MNTIEHTCGLQNIHKVEIEAYIYLLAINMNKCVYFCNASTFNATTDIKKHKFNKNGLCYWGVDTLIDFYKTCNEPWLQVYEI